VRRRARWWVLVPAVLAATQINTGALWAADPSLPSNVMRCGSCPEGYAKTGVTTDARICKEGDPTLLECARLGANILAVCGPCPEGYRQIGSSSVPARCGTAEDGRMNQCQLSKMEGGVMGPGQGGVFCPPNCAGPMPMPGKGALEPPPKVRSLPGENK
jgi:hypothetical protein